MSIKSFFWCFFLFFMGNTIKAAFFTMLFLFSVAVVIADPPPTTLVVTGGLNLHIDCLFTVDGDIKGSNGKIHVKDGKELKLTGDWINDVDEDFFQANESTVTFNSDDARQSIGGSGKTNFYNLTINNTATENPGVNLEQNIGVSSSLTMTAGDLDLKNSEIDLGSTGEIIDESETTPIKVSIPASHIGTIIRTANIDNTESFTNPGNIGVGLKPTADLGNVTIIRGHGVLPGTGSYTANSSIVRYFDITPANNDIETEMKFYFWGTELNGHNKSELIAYRYLEEIEPYYWTPLTDAMDAGTNNFVDFTTPGFSKFTLGSKDNPLPVELLYFTASWKDGEYKAVELEWETASEMNSDYYIIQRSDDHIRTWKDIKTVNAAGFSNEVIYYSELDYNPPIIDNKSFIYYRLKQVDFNNTYDYSDIVALEGPEFNIETGLYPNPAVFFLVLNIDTDIEFNSIIQVIDISGKVVLHKRYPVIKGKNIKEIDISRLKPAAYVLRILCEQETYQKQIEFIKQ